MLAPVRSLTLAVTITVVGCFGTRWLDASAYVVTPVRVTLTRETPTSTLTLRNDDKVALRLQLSVFRWLAGSQVKEMTLEPTDELLFFPPLLTVQPGETRSIRVSAKRHADETEIAYRMMVEELPPTDMDGRTGVTLLTRVSLPIFVAPSRPTRRLRVDAPRHEQGRLLMPVLNLGNVHVVVERLLVTGRTRSGTQVFEREIPGWYILPGESRLFETDLPDCKGADAITVTVRAGTLTEAVNAALEAVGCAE